MSNLLHSPALLPRVKDILFESEYYLESNKDVLDAGIDPWQHFLDNGFDEGRSPAPWLMLPEALTILKSASGDSVEPSVEDLLQVTQDANETTMRWFTPFISPAWIMFQLGVEKGSFLSIIDMEIPETGLSPQPSLQRIYPDVGMKTIRDLIKNARELDIKALSLVNLDEYLRQHRDLANELDGPLQAYVHLWTWGYAENRLKYLGGARPRTADTSTLYLLNLTLAIQSYLSGGHCYTSGKLEELTNQTVKFLDQETIDMARLDAFSMKDRTTWIDLVSFMRTRRNIHTRDTTFAKPLSLTGIRVASIFDRDLISGKHQAQSKRVVYSINLGGYDDLPEPPRLDNAEYYLITDALGVPEDSSWTIVRPSIREVEIKRTCLWYKTHPHILFPNAEFVTWIDSNVVAHEGSGDVLKAHEILSEVATFSHPDRTCIYKEAEEIVRLGLEHQDTMKRVTESMSARGMPSENGLFETNVLFTRIQDLGVQSFLEEWWSCITTGSRRDQMSFTFSAFLHQVEISTLDGPHSAKSSRYFSKRQHASNKGRFV